MPLLRQALYAQNVNLWLAPTADGRDAWLALLRTVALEGRCFVVSSNMCVRREGVANAGASAGAAADHAVEEEEDDDGAVADASPLDPRRRRNSCLTEEGFEIALPTAADAAAAAQENGGEAETEGGDEGGAYVSFPQSQNNRAGAKNGDTGNIKKQKQKQSRDGMVVNEAFVSRGGSAIVGPDGAVLAGPQWEDDYGVVYADVDFDDCIRGRLDLDAAGSYSRWVIFSIFSLRSPLSPSFLPPPPPAPTPVEVPKKEKESIRGFVVEQLSPKGGDDRTSAYGRITRGSCS